MTCRSAWSERHWSHWSRRGTAPRRRQSLLSVGYRNKVQILVIPAEIGRRRDGFHRHPIYAAIRLEREGDVRILHIRHRPMRAKRVVLHVFQRAMQAGRAIETDVQPALALLVLADRGRAVPGIPIDTGVTGLR